MIPDFPGTFGILPCCCAVLCWLAMMPHFSIRLDDVYDDVFDDVCDHVHYGDGD